MRGAHSKAASLNSPLLLGLVSLLAFFSTTSSASDYATPAPAVASPQLPPLQGYGPFTLDPRLEARVNFWVNIFSKYHSWETLLVDVRYPQLVFAVVNTRDNKGALASEKRRVVATLKRIAAKRGAKKHTLNVAELKVVDYFEKQGLSAELNAIAANPRLIRAQSGLRDALDDALFVSGRYLQRMESLFERLGLPEEIAYLPFVESGFNKRAVSRLGASGLWQFMPQAGKIFLRVDEVVDERNDPMRSAEAAARVLKQNFDALGDWPLAITAYNHGTSGMARAARETGSRELVQIIEKYEHKNFGFASQNFYACFLAALHVTKNSEAYLGAVPRARKLEFDEFVMPDFMALGDFLEKMDIDKTVFRELNPALTEEVYSGGKYLPVGYTVRLPEEARLDFLPRYEAIPMAHKFRVQKKAEAQFEAPVPPAVSMVPVITEAEPPAVVATSPAPAIDASDFVISDQKTE